MYQMTAMPWPHIAGIYIYIYPSVEDMTQQLRALSALPEDLSSIYSTHMVAHN